MPKRGVTDLVAPIMSADAVIATLITPIIECTSPTCEMDLTVSRVRTAMMAISSEISAVPQARARFDVDFNRSLYHFRI